ncbi:Hypothetical predicted protein [Octopus vulgaris]|uniref:Uncharacterized protein n=1 Tax=Octopus vulgaris TaxID=6645 RepID=A0AA36ANM5_OCTVU|nr:Hypothetical predicted protein [Octopus vulgaris]
MKRQKKDTNSRLTQNALRRAISRTMATDEHRLIRHKITAATAADAGRAAETDGEHTVCRKRNAAVTADARAAEPDGHRAVYRNKDPAAAETQEQHLLHQSAGAAANAAAAARAAETPTDRDNRVEGNVIRRTTRQGTSRRCSSRWSYEASDYDYVQLTSEPYTVIAL